MKKRKQYSAQSKLSLRLYAVVHIHHAVHDVLCSPVAGKGLAFYLTYHFKPFNK